MSKRHLFVREVATEKQDLPHEFKPRHNKSGDSVCTVCKFGADDPRHSAWESTEVASRQTAANPGFVRETGS